jgi:ubiquinone biosynthesis protein
MDWIRLIYGPLATRAARGVIIGRLRRRHAPEQGRFSRANVDSLLKGAWARYQRATPDLPPQPTMGSAMNVRLACFTMSFFDELLANGVERDYAIEIVADSTWRVYRVWAKIALAIARVRPRKRTALGFAKVDGDCHAKSITLQFPFNAPGYIIEPAASDSGIAFNVVRCPVASYFRKQGAGDLCVESWCNLDYALAELTQETLIRTKALAAGDSHCDFRVSVRRISERGLGPSADASARFASAAPGSKPMDGRL